MKKNLKEFIDNVITFNPNKNSDDYSDSYYFKNIHELLEYISKDIEPDHCLKSEDSSVITTDMLSHCIDFLVAVDKASGIPSEEIRTPGFAEEVARRLRHAGYITRDEAPDYIRSEAFQLTPKDAAEQKFAHTQATLDFPLLIMNDWLSEDKITIERSILRNKDYLHEWVLRNGQYFIDGTITFPDPIIDDDMLP